MNFENKLPVG